MSLILANYEKEREIFAEFLLAGSAQKVLLLQGESGIGKSTLLRSFADLVPTGAKSVAIELRGAAVSVAEIFYRLAGGLDWKVLHNFGAQLAAAGSGITANIDRNSLTGIRNHINVSLHSQGIIDRSERIAVLTESIFRDLEALDHLIVMTFDTFDNASTEASEWLAGPLLGRVARVKNVRVVIAGKEVPSINNIEWGSCCKSLALSGISDVGPWLAVAARLRKVIPHDSGSGWMAGVCAALKGNPAKIMQVIEGLSSQE